MATKDEQFVLKELLPVLTDIIDHHFKGTRYNIKVADDGLLFAGEQGQQLTWMDAKIADWVVTPRMGKPVEVQALWYNALCIYSELLQKDNQQVGYEELWAFSEQESTHRAQLQAFWKYHGGNTIK